MLSSAALPPIAQCWLLRALAVQSATATWTLMSAGWLTRHKRLGGVHHCGPLRVFCSIQLPVPDSPIDVSKKEVSDSQALDGRSLSFQ